MQASPIVNNTWRIFTLGSLVGCIVLVLHLNQDVVPLVRSWNPISKVKDKDEDVRCNMLDGYWVYDPISTPLYAGPQCPFLSEQVSCQRNGRSDSGYEKWVWKAKSCHIPRFNGMDILERLRGKRVILVGDSMNRNQWESLACLLYSTLSSPSRVHIDVNSTLYKLFITKDYSCSVEFYWNPFLVELEDNPANGRAILKLDKIASSAPNWKGADILVFNTGYWWNPRKLNKMSFEHKEALMEQMEIEVALRMAMRTWAKWIDTNINKTKSTVFFRSISPQHRSDQWCYNWTQPPTLNQSHTRYIPATTLIETIESEIRRAKTPIRYLNITTLSKYRRDAHPSVYHVKRENFSSNSKPQLSVSRKPFADCNHWCLPGVPDTWNTLLYASLISN